MSYVAAAFPTQPAISRPAWAGPEGGGDMYRNKNLKYTRILLFGKPLLQKHIQEFDVVHSFCVFIGGHVHEHEFHG